MRDVSAVKGFELAVILTRNDVRCIKWQRAVRVDSDEEESRVGLQTKRRETR